MPPIIIGFLSGLIIVGFTKSICISVFHTPIESAYAISGTIAILATAVISTLITDRNCNRKANTESQNWDDAW